MRPIETGQTHDYSPTLSVSTYLKVTIDTRSLRFQLLPSDGSDGDDMFVTFRTSTSSIISVAISTGAPIMPPLSPLPRFNLYRQLKAKHKDITD